MSYMKAIKHTLGPFARRLLGMDGGRRVRSIDVGFGEITEGIRSTFVGAMISEARVRAQGLRWVVELDMSKGGESSVFRFTTGYAQMNFLDVVGQRVEDVVVGPNDGTMLVLSGDTTLEVFGDGDTR